MKSREEDDNEESKNIWRKNKRIEKQSKAAILSKEQPHEVMEKKSFDKTFLSEFCKEKGIVLIGNTTSLTEKRESNSNVKWKDVKAQLKRTFGLLRDQVYFTVATV